MIIQCPWCLENFELEDSNTLTDCPNCGQDIHAERDGTAEPDYNAPSEKERLELSKGEDKG